METQELAKRIRIDALNMCHNAKASHIGGCLSCADILAVLYNEILTDKDKLIVSKGHCAAAVYAALAEMGKIPMEWLDRYCQDGAELGGHVTYGVPGVEVSTGSLGHGLSIGCGMAIANPDERIFVLMSDGECDEGSVWEAAKFAGNQEYMGNLFAIVDYNKLKSFSREDDRTDGELATKWSLFGWDFYELEGNYYRDIKAGLYNFKKYNGKRPQVAIAHTVKGMGAPFMENRLEWHYKYPNEEELKWVLDGLNE